MMRLALERPDSGIAATRADRTIGPTASASSVLQASSLGKSASKAFNVFMLWNIRFYPIGVNRNIISHPFRRNFAEGPGQEEVHLCYRRLAGMLQIDELSEHKDIDNLSHNCILIRST